MWDWAAERAPLSGLVFLVLVVVGGPVLQGSTPDAQASPASIVRFYEDHRVQERAAAVVIALAFAAMMWFAASLRARWRAATGAEGLCALLLAGASVMVVGQSISAMTGYALTAAPTHLSLGAAQALNTLGSSALPSAVGGLTFFAAAGITILRARVLPAWLGWLGVVIGVLFVLPVVEFAAFLLLLPWVGFVSVLAARTPRPEGVEVARVGSEVAP